MSWKKIRDIEPVKGKGTIAEIHQRGLKRMANSLLPKDCFWREGETIRSEVLGFIKELLKENKEITTDLICFFCSVQPNQFYENCHGQNSPKNVH